MDLDRITPVLLCYNEAPNIGRALERLRWAKDVVVVDSGSTDGTVAIVESFPNTRLFQHPFKGHGDKWNHAVTQTGVASEWILRLDSDYIVPDDVIAELRALQPPDDVAAYLIGFRYCMDGLPLRASLYPAIKVLFRTKGAGFVQDGHLERNTIEGGVGSLTARILHDDRKPMDRWLEAQHRYQAREADKLRAARWSELSWPDRVRKTRLLGAPAVLLYALFGKGLILDGWPGLLYTLQRVTADLILSMHLIQKDLADRTAGRSPR